MAKQKLYRHTFKAAGIYRTKDGREVHATEGGAINGPKDLFESHPDIVSRATSVSMDAPAETTETTEETADEAAKPATKTKK